MEKGKEVNVKISLDKIVGMNIRKERELRKITREELTEILGLTATHIGLIERGVRGATLVTLTKLARIFDVSMDSFFAEHSSTISKKHENKPTVKKITALMPLLTEPELEFLVQIVKGLVAMRKKTSPRVD